MHSPGQIEMGMASRILRMIALTRLVHVLIMDVHCHKTIIYQIIVQVVEKVMMYAAICHPIQMAMGQLTIRIIVRNNPVTVLILVARLIKWVHQQHHSSYLLYQWKDPV
jgi:hypothetical protein